MLSVEFGYNDLLVRCPGYTPVQPWQALCLRRGLSANAVDFAWSPTYSFPTWEYRDGVTTLRAHALPQVPFLIQPPGASLRAFLGNAFELHGLDFPLIGSDVPAYVFGDRSFTVKANATLSNLVTSALNKFCLRGVPRLEGFSVLRPRTALAADAALQHYQMEAIRRQPYRSVIVHYTDDAGDAHLREVLIQAPGYRSGMH